MRTSRATLTGVVFVAGVGTLATEIGASRLLAPYFGNSTIVWANVIGLTLASLSLGYWLGGRLADRRPTQQTLGLVVVTAACLVAVATFAARPILELSVEGLDRVSAGAAIGSFFGVLVLFVPPVTMLGMVAPFAIRLAITDVESAGTVAGRLYAFSTIGSLLGTFLSALVTIPAFGTQRTLIASAALIGGAGALLLGAVARARRRPRCAAVHSSRGREGTERPDPRGRVSVPVHPGRRARRCSTPLSGRGPRDPFDLAEGRGLTGGVWDTYLAVPQLLAAEPERVAMLGNAAGTAARAYERYYPDAEVDGVELDPAVSEVGRRFFGMGAMGPAHRSRSGRPLVPPGDRSAPRRDHRRCVSAPVYVPFYLATREYFELVRERLTPGGVVALNVATTPQEPRELAREIPRTMRTELPTVKTWQPLRFNQIVIGINGTPAARSSVSAPELKPLVDSLFSESRSALPSDDPWTDDQAPVEWVTDG